MLISVSCSLVLLVGNEKERGEVWQEFCQLLDGDEREKGSDGDVPCMGGPQSELTSSPLDLVELGN